jgi:hypothetical protein
MDDDQGEVPRQRAGVEATSSGGRTGEVDDPVLPGWDPETAGVETPATVLRDALAFAREREYTGWDYCDGLSNPIRAALPFENRWLNLAFQEGIKRAPVNVRPLFGVEQRRNFMGASLFAMANLTAHRLDAAGDGGHLAAGVDDPDYLAEATTLTDWLVATSRSGWSGFCGGHNHEVQHIHAKGVPSDPDVVSTSFGARALLRVGARAADDLVTTARTAADFLIEDMNYRETENGATVDYYRSQRPDTYIPNSAAIAARLLLDLYRVSGEEGLRERGEALLDRVVSCQTDTGGWTYSHPPEKSHLSMDNHHNGFIIESLLYHRSTVGTGRYADPLRDGLEFYRERLFEADGAPNWDESSTYPRDVHAAAQGILVFTYAGEHETAGRVLTWTIDNLYDADAARFHYRVGRFHRRTVTLMRWCQAWMCYAVSEYLAGVAPGSGPGALLDTVGADGDDPVL